MSNGAVQTGISFGAIIFTLPYEIFFSNMSESELGIPVSASEVASTTASLIATALSSNVSVGKKSKHLQITVRTAPPDLRYFYQNHLPAISRTLVQPSDPTSVQAR